MDERYLHRFASMRLGKKTVEKKDDDIDFDDAASVNSDEFDLIMRMCSSNIGLFGKCSIHTC